MSALPHTTSGEAFPPKVLQSSDADGIESSIAPENLEIPVCYLELNEIRRDGGTQPRAAIDLKHIKLLEQQMEDGQELEPVIVFYDGESYWLADGYHRWHAHDNQAREEIACIIHSGSRRDAVLYSVGANANHKPALPRSREDKRRAVMTIRQDEEWGQWSNREIARRCAVSLDLVNRLRTSLNDSFSNNSLQSPERTYITKHGTVTKMKIANIGLKAQAPPKELQDSARVSVTDDHPLLAHRSGTIAQMPNPDHAIVELDTGEREFISPKHLKPATAQHFKLEIGALVEVYAPGNNKINGRRGRIASVTEYTAEVWLRDVETMTMHNYNLKHQQLISLPLEKEQRLEEITARLSRLRSSSLDPFEVEILNLLDRPIAFTPIELEYLAYIEQRHGISNCF